jgi:cytochrome c peroxidase
MTKDRATGALLGLAVWALAGCDASSSVPVSVVDSGAPTDVVDDPEPFFAMETMDALRRLAYPKAGPPPDPTNAVAENPAAVELGHALFFDPRFSGRLIDSDNDGSVHALGTRGETGKVSCAGCHIATDHFVDTRSLHGQISLGAGWVVRRTPSVLDVAWRTRLMWDGGRDSLFSQAVGPFETWNEMNSSRLFVAHMVAERYRAEYEALFGPLPPLSDTGRFPPLDATKTGCVRLPGARFECHGSPGDGAEFDGMTPEDQDAVTRVVANVGKALGAYERVLSCGAGAFDRWLEGDSSALSRSAQRGAALFVGKAECVSCHSGPFLSDAQFHNVGLAAETVAVVFNDAGDLGASRGIAQLLESPLNSAGSFSDGTDDRLEQLARLDRSTLEGAFLTPPLRCIEGQPSFMHTGHIQSLEDVVEFFDRGGDARGYIGVNELHALALDPREKADLVAFLRSLEGAGPDSRWLHAP